MGNKIKMFLAKYIEMQKVSQQIYTTNTTMQEISTTKNSISHICDSLYLHTNLTSLTEKKQTKDQAGVKPYLLSIGVMSVSKARLAARRMLILNYFSCNPRVLYTLTKDG